MPERLPGALLYAEDIRHHERLEADNRALREEKARSDEEDRTAPGGGVAKPEDGETLEGRLH